MITKAPYIVDDQRPGHAYSRAIAPLVLLSFMPDTRELGVEGSDGAVTRLRFEPSAMNVVSDGGARVQVSTLRGILVFTRLTLANRPLLLRAQYPKIDAATTDDELVAAAWNECHVDH